MALYPLTTAHSIMFHHFHGGQHGKGQGSLSAEDLQMMISFIGHEHILSAEEWTEKALNGSLKANNLCFSFDDGLRCQWDIALPVLRKHKITAFFFIPSAPLNGEMLKMEVYRYIRHECFDSMDDFYAAFEEMIARSRFAAECHDALREFVPAAYLSEYKFYTDGDRRFRYIRDKALGPERFESIMDALVDHLTQEGVIDPKKLHDLLWFSANEVRSLKKEGHVIGLHSHNHPTDMAALSVEKQKEEYEINADILTSASGAPVTCMSHPCNSYTSETLKILKGLGINLGFRSRMEGSGESLLELPRQDHAHVFAMMQQS